MIRKYIPEATKERYRLIRASLLSIGLTRSGTFDQPEDEVEASKDISVVVTIHDSPQLTQRYLRLLFEKAGLKNIRKLSNTEVRGYDHGWINLGMAGTKA